MKSEMSAFDILAVVSEMQPLVGGYLDKVFHWDRKNVLLRVNVPGTGRREVVILDLKWLYLSKERPEVPETPSQFAVHARKLLSNAKITMIRQHQFDRIVVIESDREEGYQLVIELFGEGNLLIVSQGKIVNCLFSKTWKHRDVRPGADYSFPPSRFNPGAQDVGAFQEAMRGSNADVVRTLATAINLGGQYGEELCLRAGLDKTRKAKDLSEEETDRLRSELEKLLQAVQLNPSPTLASKNSLPVDVTPVELLQYQDADKERFATHSEALAAFVERAGRLKQRAENPEIQRLARQIEQQTAAREALKVEASEHTLQAEGIYAHYQDVSSFLTRFGGMALGKGWEKIKEEARSFAMALEVRPQDSSVRADFDDLMIWLDYSRGIDENANLLYSKAKEAKEKQGRAEAALNETKKRLEEMKKHEAKLSLAAKEERKPTKQFWFESYKWFVTSGGHLVLAGRDARTNDQLVKKHLTSTDRYAHADVHGAPSVVIKDGSTANEEELRQACLFALSHSKAWNAGAREGSAYWVLPDQVSKTPDAGEFVPRGAFIIRGKRNYEHHLPLELAVGEIEHQGARKIMCAPRQAIEDLANRMVVIVPGDTDRSRLSSTLSKMLNVPEEEVSRILPPGDVEISSTKGLALEL